MGKINRNLETFFQTPQWYRVKSLTKNKKKLKPRNRHKRAIMFILEVACKTIIKNIRKILQLRKIIFIQWEKEIR